MSETSERPDLRAEVRKAVEAVMAGVGGSLERLKLAVRAMWIAEGRFR